MKIETSLLREKFEIRESKPDDASKAIEIVALSNRMSISFQAGELAPEKYIIRTQNMHGCARFASVMLSEYERLGPLLSRSTPINWHELWDKALSPFERLHNPDKWVCLYHKGKIVFSEGSHHSFFDVIEKCDIVNKGNYEASIKLAEQAFSKAGRNVSIGFDSSVALVCALTRKEARCSMIARGPGRTNTFNATITPQKDQNKINIIHGLSLSADILEAVQLCYRIGQTSALLEMGHIKKFSDEYNIMREAKKRITEINMHINSIENRYHLRYRPERPDFDHITHMTEKFIFDNPPEDENIDPPDGGNPNHDQAQA